MIKDKKETALMFIISLFITISVNNKRCVKSSGFLLLTGIAWFLTFECKSGLWNHINLYNYVNVTCCIAAVQKDKRILILTILSKLGFVYLSVLPVISQEHQSKCQTLHQNPTCMVRGFWSIMVQIMVWRMMSTKPLHEAMLPHCQLGH